MKKFFLCAMAAAATLSLTSCLSEEEVNLEKGNMGRISLNISADNSLVTRADNATFDDISAWYVVVNKDSESEALYNGQVGTTLATTDFPFGSDYTISARSHNTKDVAMPNNGLGEAYYEGGQCNADGSSLSYATINAGSTPTIVYVSCGKAKNARLAIVDAGFAGTITAISIDSHLTADLESNQKNRTMTYPLAKEVEENQTTVNKLYTTAEIANATKAYFHANEEITVKFSYTIGNNTKTDIPVNFTMGNEGTTNTLSITSDEDGNIALTIKYDDTWDSGTEQTITISAETGEELL